MFRTAVPRNNPLIRQRCVWSFTGGDPLLEVNADTRAEAP